MKSLSIGLCLAAVAGLVTVSMVAAQSDRNTTAREVKKDIAEVDYVRDPRTGLCLMVHGNIFSHISCMTPNGPVPINSGARPLSLTYVSELQYARDPRTGFCLGDHYGSTFEVPCAAVQHLLIP